MPYTTDPHRHRSAAWAAGPAASVKSCRVKVQRGLAMLEDAGSDEVIQHADHWPPPDHIDAAHEV